MKRIGISLVSIFVILLLFGCASKSTDILSVDSEGNTKINTEALEDTINQNPTERLLDIERDGILYMREEEKLARDVYQQLYDIWKINNFNNIGNSEQTHIDAMESLIKRYNLTDPAENKGIGEFSNPGLQELHNGLIEQGSKSEIDALKVGAAIEEIDIIDIEEYIAQTSKQDIITVYENLLKGSRNHLRSFVSVMEKRGINYMPQYLPIQQFNDIISETVERGKN